MSVQFTLAQFVALAILAGVVAHLASLVTAWIGYRLRSIGWLVSDLLYAVRTRRQAFKGPGSGANG